MKKIAIVGLFILVIILQGCQNNQTTTETTNTATSTTTTNTSTATTYNTTTSLETRTTIPATYETEISLFESVNGMLNEMSNVTVDKLKEFNETHPGESINIFYYDNDKVGFHTSDNYYYLIENGSLYTFDVSSNFDQNTSCVIGFDPEIKKAYVVDSYMYCNYRSEINIVHTITLSGEGTFGVSHEIDDARIVSRNHQGLLVHKDGIYYIYDYAMNLKNSYENVVYLGSSQYNDTLDERYFLLGETQSDNTCQLIVSNGVEEVSRIPIAKSCEGGLSFPTKNQNVYFILGDSQIPDTMYRFEPRTLEVTSMQSELDGLSISYVENIDSYRGIYELALSNSTIICLNDRMSFDSVASSYHNLASIGDYFYVTQDTSLDQYKIYDFNNTLQGQIEGISTRTYIDGKYLIIDRNYMYPFVYQDVYQNGTNLVLSNIVEFHAISDTQVIYYLNITDTTYDIIYHDLDTDESKVLMTLDYEDMMNYMSTYVYPNGMFTIIDMKNHQMSLYTSDGLLSRTFHFLGYISHGMGYSSILVQDYNGDVMTILNYIGD